MVALSHLGVVLQALQCLPVAFLQAAQQAQSGSPWQVHYTGAWAGQ